MSDVPPLVDTTDTEFIGLDPNAVKAACAAVRSYCGWHIAPSFSEEMVLDGSGGPVQLLPTLRLTAVASITNDGAAVANPEWSSAGMVRGVCWTSKWRGVVANVTHGYDLCPDEIVSVIASLASSGLAGAPGKSLQAGPFAVAPSDAQQAGAASLSPAHMAVLDRYKIPSRP